MRASSRSILLSASFFLVLATLVPFIPTAADAYDLCRGGCYRQARRCIGGEARVFNTADKKRVATLKGHEGAVFAIAWHPDANQVVTGGFDGKLRVFETAKGELVRPFVPVPLKPVAVQQAAK